MLPVPALLCLRFLSSRRLSAPSVSGPALMFVCLIFSHSYFFLPSSPVLSVFFSNSQPFLVCFVSSPLFPSFLVRFHNSSVLRPFFPLPHVLVPYLISSGSFVPFFPTRHTPVPRPFISFFVIAPGVLVPFIITPFCVPLSPSVPRPSSPTLRSLGPSLISPVSPLSFLAGSIVPVFRLASRSLVHHLIPFPRPFISLPFLGPGPLLPTPSRSSSVHLLPFLVPSSPPVHRPFFPLPPVPRSSISNSRSSSLHLLRSARHFYPSPVSSFPIISSRFLGPFIPSVPRPSSPLPPFLVRSSPPVPRLPSSSSRSSSLSSTLPPVPRSIIYLQYPTLCPLLHLLAVPSSLLPLPPVLVPHLIHVSCPFISFPFSLRPFLPHSNSPRSSSVSYSFRSRLLRSPFRSIVPSFSYPISSLPPSRRPLVPQSRKENGVAYIYSSPKDAGSLYTKAE
ncbi:hypothetical protein C7M84_006688 [Penaeus vannamei]|uniref:Uncharacterized protein n=1 Tax=Penaeus vannamei TaxID=6689 RepID=A0A423TE92_PENVA|nr:hypothetical protein C7M84_006688 [Penaeus vannamei]